jgi:hypothetical protein
LAQHAIPLSLPFGKSNLWTPFNCAPFRRQIERPAKGAQPAIDRSASLLFDDERPGLTLPAKYLKTPGQ